MDFNDIATFVDRKIALQERLYGKNENKEQHREVLIKETVRQNILSEELLKMGGWNGYSKSKKVPGISTWGVNT